MSESQDGETRGETVAKDIPSSPKDEASIGETPQKSNATEDSVQYSNDPDILQAQLGLEPTTIVLAKVKGYRAWPAMVLAYDILPENIKQMRPKSVKQARKLKQPLIVVPVRFFSDDTYIWIKSADLKLLSKEEIDAFLDKRANAKKHDTLIDAYKLAQNPPDMGEFNKWGSAGPPPDVPDTTEDIFDEDEEEPPRKKLKLKIFVKKGKNAGEKTNSKSNSKSKTSKSKSKAKPKVAASEEEDSGYGDYEEFERELDESFSEPEPEYDSDWGIGEDDFDFVTGDFIFEDEKEQKEFSVEFPRASELSKTLAYYNKQLLAKHKSITPKLLLESKMNEHELLNELREVNKLIALGDVPKIAFTKSKLFRALLVTAHKPQEKFPHRVVRSEIDKIFKLVPLTACKLTMEDLVVPTPEETPAETPRATPGPDVKEEVEEKVAEVENGHNLSNVEKEN